MNDFQQELDNRKQERLLRQLPLLEEGIDFYSNDYLGLSKSQALYELIDKKTEKIQLNGATGSRLLSGNSQQILKVEENIARFHHQEAALIYGSGYTANLGLLSSLGKKGTTFIMDDLVHASLIDGARLSQAKRVRFRHNDLEDLKKKLEVSEGNIFVVVESIYSMDGDISPLKSIAELCEKHNVYLIVDEAHGVGVFGKNGGGLLEELELQERIFASVVTYGKAPGIHGAAVIGTQWLKDYQVNFSRPLIFSTAPSPHQIFAIEAFYQLVPSLSVERKNLSEIANYFVAKRKGNTQHQWLNSSSHIQSLIVPGNDQVISLAKKLNSNGINALPIRKPSVAEGTERIRFCLHTHNTKEEIDLLFEILAT